MNYYEAALRELSKDDIFRQMWHLKIREIVIVNLRLSGMLYKSIIEELPRYGYSALSMGRTQSVFTNATRKILFHHRKYLEQNNANNN